MPATWGNRAEYGEFKIAGAAEGRPKLLGQGSFGKTYEAVRIESVGGNVIEEVVALKVLNPELLSSASKRFQFVQERTALSRRKHANLIHSIKCGEDNGEVYFVMELCMGGDLSRLVKRFGALPERVMKTRVEVHLASKHPCSALVAQILGQALQVLAPRMAGSAPGSG